MTSRVAPEIGTGAVSAETSACELVLVALDGHDQRVDVDRGDPEPGGRARR